MSNNLPVIDGNSTLQSIKTTATGTVHTPHHNIEKFPATSKDAFGRLRTASPGYRFDSQLTYRIDEDLWDKSAKNSGNVTHRGATERWVCLSAKAGAAGTAVLQSHYHAPYTPGCGQLAFITMLMGAAPGTGGFKRCGYYDGTNGIYLERTSTAVNLVLKSSTSKGSETVPQASWNIDPMNGSGPSGITLDLTKMQILVIQMQALYVGSVTVAFDIGGDIVPVHRFDCSNKEAVLYIAQASLPVRFEVGSTVATPDPVMMYAVCASVLSEGGDHLLNMAGRTYTAFRELVNTASATLMTIRCRSHLNTINQNVIVMPTDLTIAVTDAGAWVTVYRNSTITGGTFASAGTGSVIDVATDSVDGADGKLVDAFYVPASATVRLSSGTGLLGKVMLNYSHLLAAGDRLSVLVNGGETSDYYVALKWKEIR